jgi:hypothetical protein
MSDLHRDIEMSGLQSDTERELAALADGSLAPERREQALERVRRSPELQTALEEQRRAVEVLAAAGAGVEAPASLHERIESMLEPMAGGRASALGRGSRGALMPRRDRRRAWIGGLAAATAVAIAAVAVALGPSGGSSALSVQQAAALTLSPATMTAPAESSRHHAQLSAAVGGVPFPYWGERFGWHGSGARSDLLAGHTVRTVFYTNAEGRRIGYAIASGKAPMTSGGTVVRRWGVSYRLLSQGGATVVTWQRAGHLCVMAGRGVSAGTLLSLASWDDRQPRAA